MSWVFWGDGLCGRDVSVLVIGIGWRREKMHVRCGAGMLAWIEKRMVSGVSCLI